MLVGTLFCISNGQRSRSLGQLTSKSVKSLLVPQFLSYSFHIFRRYCPNQYQNPLEARFFIKAFKIFPKIFKNFEIFHFSMHYLQILGKHKFWGSNGISIDFFVSGPHFCPLGPENSKIAKKSFVGTYVKIS